ncbi:MAG: hypothetical protein U0031_22665 [Thermomicrobiales bacterium]
MADPVARSGSNFRSEADAACPTLEQSATAVAKAVAARRARHRGDAVYAVLTTAAIAERVTGITLPPRSGHDGWWLVGRVLDELAETEFSVWFMPGARRTGISERQRPAVTTAPPPINLPYYYDGLRRKWIDTLTGEVIAGPDTNQPGDYESRPRRAT